MIMEYFWLSCSPMELQSQLDKYTRDMPADLAWTVHTIQPQPVGGYIHALLQRPRDFENEEHDRTRHHPTLQYGEHHTIGRVA